LKGSFAEKSGVENTFRGLAFFSLLKPTGSTYFYVFQYHNIVELEWILGEKVIWLYQYFGIVRVELWSTPMSYYKFITRSEVIQINTKLAIWKRIHSQPVETNSRDIILSFTRVVVRLVSRVNYVTLGAHDR